MAVNETDLDQVISSVDDRSAGGAPLDKVTAARDVAARLDLLAQHVVAHFVGEARRAGASWTDIGSALGVTRQAAQQRFVPTVGRDVDAVTANPAPPYTARGSAALLAARDLAAEHRHRTVEDVHLLVGVLDSRSSRAVNVLRALGHRAADLRRTARGRLAAEGPRRAAKNPPLGRSGVRVVDGSVREALRLGAAEVGTEHELLALAGNADTPAGQLLAEAGITYPAVRQELERQLSAEASRAAEKRARRRR